MASKILAAVAHEWAGICKGLKEISCCRRVEVGIVSTRRSRGFPWLVVILLINEMIRLGNFAATQATALTFAVHLRPSKALLLCQDQVVRASGRSLPRFGTSFYTSKSGA